MVSAKDNMFNPGHFLLFLLERVLDYYGKKILEHIFYKNIGAPDNGTEKLFNFLSRFKNHLKIYSSEEYNKVFPPNRITYDEQFDISVFGRVILTILGIYCENENNYFSQKDLECIREDIRITRWFMYWRNKLVHEGNKDISETKFEEWWVKIIYGLLGQPYCSVDMESIVGLRRYGDIFSNNKYQGTAQFLSQGKIVYRR